MNYLFERWAGDTYNPKIVLVLGGPGAGKTYIANKFVENGFRLALMDQYFEALQKKKTGSDRFGVSIQNPDMKKDYVWSAVKNDNRISYYLSEGYPFVTEKTGQNFGTITQLKKLAESHGYDLYGIYVATDVETALNRNNLRPRSLEPDELRKTHEKVVSNMYPSDKGAGISSLFAPSNFFEIKSNDNIDNVVRKIVSAPKKLATESFQAFYKMYEAETDMIKAPGVIKVINNPSEQGNMLIYNIKTILEPGKSIMLSIPESHRHLMVRDMVLAHRKGPYGHGEPNMKWEPEKNKWRDYYGAYTRVEAHDVTTDKWHTYVDDYGASFKFAEHRPGEYEEETLHDWIKIGEVRPDAIKLSNPGNQRARPHPMTGEKVDPMDQRSSAEIATLKVVFFPNVNLGKGMQFYERFYSKVGGSQDSPAKFADFGSQDKDELQPVYGNYGAGIYPNALVLVSDWSRQGKRIKQMDGQYWFITDKESFDQVGNEVGERVQRASADPFYQRNARSYVKVFPVTLEGGPGTTVKGNSLFISVPSQLIGKKLAQVEVMCGDTEFRPDRIARNQPWKRLGFAHLHIGVQNKMGSQWFTAPDGISVAPQMVAAAAPQEPKLLNADDKIVIKSEQDTTYVMGWRVAYS